MFSYFNVVLILIVSKWIFLSLKDKYSNIEFAVRSVYLPKKCMLEVYVLINLRISFKTTIPKLVLGDFNAL